MYIPNVNGLPLCPKCSVPMEEGFMADLGLMGANQLARWTAGPAVKSFATGVRKVSRKQYRVQTFRCDTCGLLQSYATARAN